MPAAMYVMLSVLGAPGTANAELRHVPGDYATIQAAVDAAVPNDTVLVAPGVYTDSSEVMIDGEVRLVNVYIRNLIHLIAAGSAEDTKIDASAANVGIYVYNAMCDIKGFEIVTRLIGFGCIVPYKSEAQLTDIYSAVLCDNATVTVENCDIHDHQYAVYLRSAIAFIYGNQIYDAPDGIWCENLLYGEIHDNEFYNCGHAIFCDASSPIIENNHIFNTYLSCFGIYMKYSSPVIRGNHVESMMTSAIEVLRSRPLIESNVIEDCWDGIEVFASDSTTIANNLLVAMGDYAVEVFASAGVRVQDNTFINVGLAIVCQSSESDPIVGNNIIHGAGTGIICVFGASPAILCNDIFDAESAFFGTCNTATGQDGNFSLDPEFCGVPGSGNFYLQTDSPCAPGNHPDGIDCGLIGAFDVNCGLVPVEKTTWGGIKSLFDHGKKR
jgi:parallel beta-helix repeat protein